MASNPQTEGLSDDFLEQILAIPSYAGGDPSLAASDGNLAGTASSMVLQLSSGDASAGFPPPPPPPPHLHQHQHQHQHQLQHQLQHQQQHQHQHQHQGGVFPLGLSMKPPDEPSASGGVGKRCFRDDLLLLDGKPPSGKNNSERDSMHLTNLFPAFGHVEPHVVRPTVPLVPQPFHVQPTPSTIAVVPHPPTVRPRVRARRGQATDPHSIAERLRRERIAERMKALQELVPSSNKTDRAAMLDEIVDYVKFLRLQVKVLSMSRLGGAGAVAQLVADIPLSSVESGASEGGSNQAAWEKWSNDGTEQQVAKLMEEDVGAAMQFLQSKALCIMPISLATAIYHTHQPEPPTLVKPEPSAPS